MSEDTRRAHGAPTVEAGQLSEPRLSDHLARVAALVKAEHLPEAELEALRALTLRPSDLRALKLLALIRFKRGRYAEAREVYEVLARTVPDDSGVRMALGLIALKMDLAEEAVAELEVAVRLGEASPKVWTNLGYAHARLGRNDLAAGAFRRAGHDDLAEAAGAGTLFSSAAPEPQPLPQPKHTVVAPPPEPPVGARQESGFWVAPPLEPVASAPAAGEVEVEGFAPAQDASGEADEGAGTTLTNFVLGRLLDVPVADEFTSPFASLVGEVLRFSVSGEAHVRASALLAATGRITLAEARRRVRGRVTLESLREAHDDFLLCEGRGELWLAPSVTRARLLALSLEEDILFIRQSRVVAFDQDVVWEAGRLPGDALPLLQLRGTGRAVLDVGEERFRAFKVPADRPLWVERRRLLGWVGRVVARAVKRPSGAGEGCLVACEGEGVLLVCVHGLLDQPTDERAQSGDDGAGAADSRGAAVHR